jgi:phosphate transport system protein
MSDISGHIVKSYEQELRRLRELLTEMGGLVENQVAAATGAVVQQDADIAGQAVEQDPAVDAREREIEQLVIRLLALRQPVAGDLREIVAALKISSDLERIGDYAANVAKRAIVLSELDFPVRLAGLSNMARLVQESLRQTVDAVTEMDAERALLVWRSDTAIDDIYTSIFRELITYMMEDARNITPCTHLLFVAKNLERIGDHATNVAELVHYAATGEALTEARPKGESPTPLGLRGRG